MFIIKCSTLFVVLGTLFSLHSFAADSTSSVSYVFATENFSMITVKGSNAKEMYEHLRTPARVYKNAMGDVFGMIKYSQDGRMNCQEHTNKDYTCAFTIDSTTGVVKRTWAENVRTRRSY
jgi:hypothetical protein